jgi:hypothetical protein
MANSCEPFVRRRTTIPSEREMITVGFVDARKSSSSLVEYVQRESDGQPERGPAKRGRSFRFL